MKFAFGVVLSALACACAGAQAAGASELQASAFTIPIVSRGAEPGVVVLQRTITREWGPAGDSTDRIVDIPGFKSEGWAAVLSGLAPGSGQLYVGEGSGWLFALAEASGWVTRVLFLQQADDREVEGIQFAGDPSDSASAWSFERWQDATGGDPSPIEALYAADRESFYQRIAEDPVYAQGWTGSTPASHAEFKSIRDAEERARKRARYATAGVWVNHFVAALDALRAARLHNQIVRQNLGYDVKTGWRHGGPIVRVALVGKF